MSRPNLTILIVDRDLEVAHHVGEALERDGHRVTLAHTAGAAIARAHAEEHDVVLLDLDLADSDSVEAVRVMREHAPDAVIVAIALDADNASKVEPLVDLSLIKPIDRDLLSGLLVFLYEKRRTKRPPR